MAPGIRDRIPGCGIAGSLATRRFHPPIRGGRELGGGGGVVEVGGGGGGGRRKLDARRGQIEGHEGGIEEEGGWIVVYGRRIGRAGLRINSHGEVYAPDSEDEGTDTEMEDVGAERAAAATMVPATGSPDVATVDGAPVMEVAVDGSTAMEVAADEAQGVELAPEVQAHLQAVLAGIDPVYHAIFISLYKLQLKTLWYSFCARELLLRVTDPPQFFCGQNSWAFLS